MKYQIGDIVRVFYHLEIRVGIIMDTESFDDVHLYRMIISGYENKLYWVDEQDVAGKINATEISNR